MRIKKTSQTTPIQAEVVNVYSDSENNAYGCDYMNELNTYKTTEQRIGTWIDGKPLYRKCFEVPKSQMSNQRADIALTNVSEIINLRGMVYRTDNIWFTIPKASLVTEWNCIFGDSTASNINVSFGSSIYSVTSKIYVIVEYTKTTD